MAEKVQTITEIRHHLAGMFAAGWPDAEARAMAGIIIEEFTGLSGARQVISGDHVLRPDIILQVMEAAGRAQRGEPLQYIFGFSLFCGHRMEVSPAVLIPRPETEEMTSMIIAENKGFKGTLTDLCTGSGCIAISLSLEFPEASVNATDKSEDALVIARRNAETNNARVIFSATDILEPGPGTYPPCDIIVSNPPYVRESEREFMHRNVLDHEPHDALFVPDSDPLLFYRKIAEIARSRLRKDGRLYLEINEALGRETAGLFTWPTFSNVDIINDIRGKNRFLRAERHEG